MCLAAENNHSEGVKVPGIQMTALVNLAILENQASLSFERLFYVHTLFM